MLIRYKTSENGKLVKQAEVFTKDEHKINYRDLDQDAVKIIRRLDKAGYESYIVGGAVRDLLLGKLPNDFDIVTAAEPAQIRRLFRNSRIIGKRFRLVHVYFRDQKIIETSTFRSADSKGFNNVYGEIEEDALRRDFSMNALYYDPIKEQVVDFVGGFKDVRSGRLRAVIPLKRIFVEDPVRILRAIKYQVKTGLQPGFFLRRKIRAQSNLLADISTSRLTEEIYKILGSGDSAEIFTLFLRDGILDAILPILRQSFINSSGVDYEGRFIADLKELDAQVAKNPALPRNIMVRQLTRLYVLELAPWSNQKRPHFPEVYAGIKEALKPMIPANKDVEDVVVSLLRGGHEASGQRKKNRTRRRHRNRKPKRTDNT